TRSRGRGAPLRASRRGRGRADCLTAWWGLPRFFRDGRMRGNRGHLRASWNVENCHVRDPSATLLPPSGYLKSQMKPADPVGYRRAWRLLFAATLAFAGQLGIFGASLTLAREEASAIAHVERSGIALHHGHNEATCAACATLSL